MRWRSGNRNGMKIRLIGFCLSLLLYVVSRHFVQWNIRCWFVSSQYSAINCYPQCQAGWDKISNMLTGIQNFTFSNALVVFICNGCNNIYAHNCNVCTDRWRWSQRSCVNWPRFWVGVLLLQWKIFQGSCVRRINSASVSYQKKSTIWTKTRSADETYVNNWIQ